MTLITPFGGWLLIEAVEIDTEFAGFAGHLHRCSAERRHVIASYISRETPTLRFGSVAEMGKFLVHASHDEILQAAFATVPSGLRRALGRGGSQPYRRRHYGYLHALMFSERRPTLTRLIPNLPAVNPSRLRVARALPADLRIASLVMAIKDQRLARDLGDLLQLLEEAGSDRQAMITSIAAVKTFSDIRDWARRWAFRVRLPEHPVPSATGYMPIQSGGELKSIALRFRNCARNYLASALEGRSAFAVVSQGANEAVVHLICERNLWALEEVYGVGNSEPDPALVSRATSHLAQHGIGPRGQRPRPQRRWASLRSVAGHLDYGVRDDWEFE